MRGATTLDHQLKDILKNQSAEPKFFGHHFFYCIKIWNGIDPELQNINSNKEFKSEISPFIKIKLNSIFSVNGVYGVKLLYRYQDLISAI